MVDSNTLSFSSLLSSSVKLLYGLLISISLLRLIRGRQNAHAGYVNEPSLVTTEPFSVMTVMTGFTSDVGILHLLNTTDYNQ
jgi:hypothetical protein